MKCQYCKGSGKIELLFSFVDCDCLKQKENEAEDSILEINEGGIKFYKNKEGLYHRIDGPAIEYTNGNKSWYQNGKRHRTDGPAIEWSNGDKHWFRNGQRHRIDGPAVEYSTGYKAWYQNGIRHRIDGPAIENSNGTKEWWENGVKIK